MFHLRNFDHRRFPDLCKDEFEAILQDEYSQISSFRQHKKEIKHGSIQTKIFLNLEMPPSNKMITFFEQQTKNKLEPINPNHVNSLAQRRNDKRYKEAEKLYPFMQIIKKPKDSSIDPIELSLLLSDVYHFDDFIKKILRTRIITDRSGGSLATKMIIGPIITFTFDKNQIETFLKNDFDAASIPLSTDRLKVISQIIIDQRRYIMSHDS